MTCNKRKQVDWSLHKRGGIELSDWEVEQLDAWIATRGRYAQIPVPEMSGFVQGLRLGALLTAQVVSEELRKVVAP